MSTRSFLHYKCILVLFLTLLFPLKVYSEDYAMVVVTTSNAGDLGTSIINAAHCAPSIEGNYIVFRTLDQTSGIPDGIWSYHIPTKKFTKLAGLQTAVPGGSGTFFRFGVVGSSLGGPVLKDGTVVFGGEDSGTNPQGAAVGIYSVPVAGGTIKKIANYNTAAPNTPTNFFNFGEDSRNFGSISHKNGTVVFEGTFGGGPIGGTGLYHSSVNGGTITTLGDSNNPWNPAALSPVKNFYNPATNGSGVAFFGGTVFGTFGLFYSTIPSGGATNFNLLVGPDTALPGATAPHDDTRFVFPSTQMDGSRIGFIGQDPSSETIGVYVTNTAGSSFETVVTNKANLNDIATFPHWTVNPFSFAMDGLNTLFLIYASHNDQALYLRTPSGLQKMADTSLVLEGVPLYDFIQVTPGALDNSRFVFAYSTITFPRSVLVLGIPESQLPEDFQAQQQLIADALALLPTARRNPPSGTTKRARKKRKRIRKARSDLKALITSMLNLVQNQSGEAGEFNNENLTDLQSAVRKGSARRTKRRARKKAWNTSAGILNTMNDSL